MTNTKGGTPPEKPRVLGKSFLTSVLPKMGDAVPAILPAVLSVMAFICGAMAFAVRRRKMNERLLARHCQHAKM